MGSREDMVDVLGARKKALENVNNLRTDLLGLDCKICNLLLERESKLLQIEKDISEMCVDMYTIGVSRKELVGDWEKNRFGGDIVKKSVGYVRNMLFDDSVESFRNFNCSGLSFMSPMAAFRNTFEEVEYEFSRGESSFSVWIQTSDIDDNSYGGIHPFSRGIEYYSDESRFSEKKWMGRMLVSIRLSNEVTSTYLTSLNVDEIREGIRSIVSDFEGIRKSMISKMTQERKEYMLNQYLGDWKYANTDPFGFGEFYDVVYGSK